MPLPDVETRITHTRTSRLNNGRESAESTTTTLTVGPRTSAGRFTLLHLEELLEQARKQGAPLDTPAYFYVGGLTAEILRPVAVKVDFRPDAMPESAGEEK